MLFDEIETLNDIICFARSNTRFRDDQDAEVDRLYSSSPQMSEFDLSMTFIAGTMPDELPENSGKSPDSKSEAPKLEKSVISPTEQQFSNLFRPVPVHAPSKPIISSLSRQLQAKTSGAPTGKGNSNRLQLTIYLPDCSSMSVSFNESDNFDEVIKKILRTHKEERRKPELYYTVPDFYELRMHEGDGMPDTDFPALNRSKNFKEFNLTECCLCPVDDDLDPPEQGLDSDGDDSPSSPTLDENSVLINVPNAAQFKLRFEDGATLKDLLPEIAEQVAGTGHKLRLYTDEFCFVVPPEEQTRLKLATPIVHLDTVIRSVGTQRFELQKRVFADSVRTARRVKNQPRQDTENPEYREAVAAVYQEWNVVKKNKFGKKQDRIIGIDGRVVYNLARDRSGKWQRELTTIRKVDQVTTDKKAFKITWEEGGALIDNEYTCESAKECGEITSKLNFLLSRKR